MGTAGNQSRAPRSGILQVARVLVVMVACVPTLKAIEKYAISKDAQIVLTGELKRVMGFPWFGGWRFYGELEVREVLWRETPLGKQPLSYRFVCSCCPYWPRPDIASITNRLGLWFLNRSGADYWESAGTCSDAGFRPIYEINNFRNFLQLRRGAAHE